MKPSSRTLSDDPQSSSKHLALVDQSLSRVRCRLHSAQRSAWGPPPGRRFRPRTVGTELSQADVRPRLASGQPLRQRATLPGTGLALPTPALPEVPHLPRPEPDCLGRLRSGPRPSRTRAASTANTLTYTPSWTVGQPAAGTTMTGDGYCLVGGFWGVAWPAQPYRLHLPLAMRGNWPCSVSCCDSTGMLQSALARSAARAIVSAETQPPMSCSPLACRSQGRGWGYRRRRWMRTA